MQEKRINEAVPPLLRPFRIVQRIGQVVYKSVLLEVSRIHLVFYISCLKRKVGPLVSLVTAFLELPKINVDGLIKEEPIAILDHRMMKQNNWAVVEVLI